MKTKNILGLAVLVGLGVAGSANAAIITKWTYETAPPANLDNSAVGPVVPADIGVGASTGVHVGALTDWSTPSGNGSVESFSSNEWAIGDYYQFTTSTVGFSGITLLMDATSSGTGPKDFKVQYSTDGVIFTDAPGATYTTNSAITFSAGLEQTTTPPRFGFDFSAITALDNQAALTLRLVATGAPTGTAGTSRVDNVTIGTDPVPEPGMISVLAGAAVLGLRRRRRA